MASATTTKSKKSKSSGAKTAAPKAATAKSSPSSKKANVADVRARAARNEQAHVGPVGGRVDSLTRRHDGDVLEGHFCRIDTTDSAAKKGLEDVLGKDLDVRDHDYGVYLEPASIDGEGYPDTAKVRLRDDTNALVVVPYSALRPSEAGHR
jgi:hypothetical protein